MKIPNKFRVDLNKVKITETPVRIILHNRSYYVDLDCSAPDEDVYLLVTTECNGNSDVIIYLL